ncbi:structural protein [Microcystis phage Mel-JY01]
MSTILNNIGTFPISESYNRLLQLNPNDNRTLLDGTGSSIQNLYLSGSIEAEYIYGDGSGIFNVPMKSGTISSSAQVLNSLVGTNIISSSDQKNILGLSENDSPIFAGLSVNGTIYAKQFETQYVSSSIIYQSGSTKFGDTIDDTHEFTGSIYISGSIIGAGLISSSAQIQNLGFTTSSVSTWDELLNKPSGIISSSTQVINSLIGTNIISSSQQRSIIGLSENDNVTFLNINSNNGIFSGNVFVDGTITARTYVISSSVINYDVLNVSGSSKFGDTFDDTHQFTGSVFVSGSVNVGNNTITDNISTTNISGSFYGIFYGDGSNLSGVASTLIISASNISSSIGLNDSYLQINSTDNNIDVGIDDNKFLISLSENITVSQSLYVGNNLSVTDNLYISGNLVVLGNTTMISSSNLIVSDQFILISSGSAGTLDGGIIIASGSNETGSALLFDMGNNRWGVSRNIAANATSVNSEHYLSTIKEGSGSPSTVIYGVGEIYVDSSNGDVWIYA